MTRPQIIRADTIDLQDHGAPSAKDHTRQPTHPAPLGVGPPAPHQAGAIRQAEEATEQQELQHLPISDDIVGEDRSAFHEEAESRGSQADELGLNGQIDQDEQAVRLNGGHIGAAGEDAEVSDLEGDDSLDDDMMDKLSSSPSIDDGGYTQPLSWPARADSLNSLSSRTFDLQLSSPYTISNSSSLSVTIPVRNSDTSSHKEGQSVPSEDHHQGGGYEGGNDREEDNEASDDESRDLLGPLTSESTLSYFRETFDHDQVSYDMEFDGNDIQNFLLPSDDPLLDNSFDDAPLSPSTSLSSSPSSISSWDEETANDDDAEDVSFSDDSRFIDSGWGGECLREIEDIDFKFVYALHNFFATVEGQANATKGDTMVLLDDSNSYWWLVRVVKDSSIGYLPAEHIETPTERLARLNKHRNIDLSATMLGDNTEKSRNPLKKAMRRRNAKTVQFCAPTYVEASDVEYSTDEEDGEADPYLSEAESSEGQSQAQANGAQQHEDATVAEAVKLSNSPKDSGVDDIEQHHSPVENGDRDISTQAELPLSNDDVSDPHATAEDVMNGKSRRGTVRNTDSFFKDDSVETRKISLTPNLLRDDSSTSTIKSNESKELKTRTSFDTLEKTISPTERSKEDRKKKEKRPGMLSGLFKRKDKKSKSQDEEADDSEKVSGEITRLSPQPKGSLESLRQEAQSSRSPQQPQRHPSKLQKAPPGNLTLAKNEQLASRSTPVKSASQAQAPPDRPAPTPNAAAYSMRVVSPDIERRIEDTPAPLRIRSPEQSREPTIAPTQPEPKPSGGVFAPITSALRSSPSSSDPKPEKVKKSKRRVAMDDFDSSPDPEEHPDPLEGPQNISPEHTATEYTSPEQAVQPADERLSESPVQVSPVDPQTSRPTPALMVDTSSQEEPSISPPSSPELIEAPETKPYNTTPTSTAQSQPSSAAPAWSDASLRTYLEDDSEIRDLLVVVHDNSGVVPAGPDHPITGGLFKEENRRLGELSLRLDNMLGDWLARKSKATDP